MKLLTFLTALFWLVAIAPASAMVSSLHERLASGERVRVVVVFDLPDPVSLEREHRADRMAMVARATDEIVAHAADGFELTHRFQLTAAMAGIVDRNAFERLEAHPHVHSISVDVGGAGALDVAMPLLGIDNIHQESPSGWGIDGAGIKIVVVDSGIDAGHADFAGALVDEGCFCFRNDGHCCPNGGSTQFGPGAATDDHGHGTWVSSHVLGRGNVAPIGAAPAASLVAVKVLDSENKFQGVADVTAAFDWVAVNHPDAAVINASLGTIATSPVKCDNASPLHMAMSEAVAALTANGTVVIASSGNQGNTDGLQLPSCLTDVIAVGATWKEDRDGSFGFSGFGAACSSPQVDPRRDDVACFSNSSPYLDILAPGVLMNASALGGGTASGISGTSFAAPLVAGCAALIIAAHPLLSWTDVRRTLLASPVKVTDYRTAQVRPRLDCLDAIRINRFGDRFESSD